MVIELPAPSIAGKHTRAELGMRAPKSVSHVLNVRSGGSTIHWGGNGSNVASHEACKNIWRGWQKFHMDGRGWADIAYTMGFCQHGWVFPGRGYGVRTAAQGTNPGNDLSYAFVHLNSAAGGPTQAALAAMVWLVDDARVGGRAGRRVWGHRDWHTTGCPGDALYPFAKALDNRTAPDAPPDPKDPPGVHVKFPLAAGWYFGQRGERHVYYSPLLKPWQRQMVARGWKLNINGYMDDNSTRIARQFQDEKKLGVDGLVGPGTWDAAWTAPIT